MATKKERILGEVKYIAGVEFRRGDSGEYTAANADILAVLMRNQGRIIDLAREAAKFSPSSHCPGALELRRIDGLQSRIAYMLQELIEITANY